MNYLSVCSGIEAPSVAWHPLAWIPVAFAEIEAFPCAVLKHHFPRVPNLGDITRFRSWPDAVVDVLVGGTPCQSFSVAGFRKGLADPRGNLALVYLAIAERYQPRWLIWENVPGVLSSNDGRDFGAFLGGLAELGYHAAWRVLDAQYIRVDGFAEQCPSDDGVSSLSDILETGDVPPRFYLSAKACSGIVRRAERRGKEIAPTIEARANAGGAGWGTDFLVDGGLVPEAANPLTARMTKGVNTTMDEGVTMVAMVADPICANEQRTYTHEGEHNFRLRNVVAFAQNHREELRELDAAGAVSSIRRGDAKNETLLAQLWKVRRLTPLECERLQGFPDGYTAVRYRRKAAADGPRYRALGNSMAVNVIRWLGARIDMVEALA